MLRDQGWPLAWPRDPVELARACASALSFVSDTKARDVHVLSFRRAYLRWGTPSEMRYATQILSFLEEIQDLGHGYWFPAPTRIIVAGQFSIVLSISPTWELSRNLDVTAQGVGRTAKTSEVDHLPKQQLSDWLPLYEPNSPEEGLRKSLAKAKSSLQPASSDQHVEFLSRPEPRNGSTVAWSKSPSKALTVDSMALCRRPVSRTFAHYFLGKVSSRGLLAEGIEVADPEYVQFLFASGAGVPIDVDVRLGKDSTSITFPIRPPRAERKLLMALARRTGPRMAYTYSASSDCANVVTDQIRRLGVRVRS